MDHHPNMEEAETTPNPLALVDHQLHDPLSSLPLEFLEDVNIRLGRANGNVYHRKPGVEGVHDGQIMVRLKKKRFIVIDYGITPADLHDNMNAESFSSKVMPNGAGRQTCASPNCRKVGIPVLLYDSVPNEPPSLYLRSGLCFRCQRNLNEKRRTQRKRKGDEPSSAPSSASSYAKHKAANGNYMLNDSASMKRYKLNEDILTLQPDAIVINGPLEGTRRYADHATHYSLDEITSDVKHALSDATDRVHTLLETANSIDPAGVTPNNDNSREHPGDTNAGVFATAAAVAAAAALGASDDQATASAVAAAASLVSNAQSTPESKEELLLSEYHKAVHSLKTGLYLLTQWKVAFDEAQVLKTADRSQRSQMAVAEAVAAAVANSNINNDTLALSDMDSNNNPPSNMIPLLLAAESKGECVPQQNVAQPGQERPVVENMPVGAVPSNPDVQIFGV